MAMGLLVLLVYGGYTAVTAFVGSDGEGAGSQQAASAAQAGTRGVMAPARAVATQAPGPVDCAVTPCVALTFDDGPVPQTADVVDLLAARGARATFYVVGEQAKRYASVLRHATEGGNEIGNHSWSHVDLRRADPRTAAKELDRTGDAIEEATGVRPATMRPPFGGAVTSVAAQAGLPQVLWSVDTRDWEAPPSGSSTWTNLIVSRAQAGGSQTHPVILMHSQPDGSASTLAALPRIITYYRDRGYTFVDLLGRQAVRPVTGDWNGDGVDTPGVVRGGT